MVCGSGGQTPDRGRVPRPMTLDFKVVQFCRMMHLAAARSSAIWKKGFREAAPSCGRISISQCSRPNHLIRCAALSTKQESHDYDASQIQVKFMHDHVQIHECNPQGLEGADKHMSDSVSS